MRAITFPKTGPGEWTNRETGVQIVASRGGLGKCYQVRTPTLDSQGFGICGWPLTLKDARAHASAVVEAVREMREIGREAACREDAQRMAKAEADSLIHHANNAEFRSDCGVDVLLTPYTYASPEWPEVTCKPCLLKRLGDESERCETCGEDLRSIRLGTLGHIPGEPCARPSDDKLPILNEWYRSTIDPTVRGKVTELRRNADGRVTMARVVMNVSPTEDRTDWATVNEFADSWELI